MKAKEADKEVSAQMACDVRCDAQLTLHDSAVCTCQRGRLERDYSRDELEKIAALSGVESRIRAVQDEGLDMTSRVMLDLKKERDGVMEKIDLAEISKISMAYSVAKRICDEQKTAEAIARGQ